MGFDHRRTVTHRLAQAAHAYRVRAGSRLARIELHSGQDALLKALHESDGMSMSDLAASLGVQPPTVTKMLQRMETSDLVDRRPDATDRRAIRVYLTPKGRRLKGKVDKLWAELGSRAFDGLSDRQRSSLRSLLSAVEGNLATR